MRLQVVELPHEQGPDGQYRHPYLLVFDQATAQDRQALPDEAVLTATSGARGVVITSAAVDVT